MTALAWIVLALTAGPIGAAVFVVGFVHGESPCILCWAQRTGMVLIAVTGLFILRYGPRPRYVGLAVLLAAAGIYMGLRHSALHVARDIGQGFSGEIFGAHTNTWSLFIFWSAALVMGLLVLSLRDGALAARPRALTRFETFVGWLLLVTVAANAVQAFASTGPPPFVGQSDPVRFSFNPAHWVWSLEEWAPAPIALRGRYLVPHPSLDGVDADPAAGPFASLQALGPMTSEPPLHGLETPVSGLAYDAATDRFAVSTRHGVWMVSGDLSRLAGHVVVDPAFSVDLGAFGDTLFLDSRTVMAVSENKSYVVLRVDERADASATYRFFLVPGPFGEVTRGRFATVRARMMFVRAAAFDPVANAIVTVGLPNPRSPRLVVSTFDRGDLGLSQEFLPSVDPASGLALRAGHSIDDLYVTAATIHEGRLWALSAASSTLLTLDVNRRRVTGAWSLPGVRRPAGIAVRAGRLVIAAEDGAVVSVPLPADRAAP